MRLGLISIGFIMIAGLFLSREAMLLGDAPAKLPPRLMDKLPVGGAVAVKDVGLVYELTIFEDGAQSLGYVVVESTPEYVTLRDLAGVSDKVLPWWSIKGVTILRRVERKDAR